MNNAPANSARILYGEPLLRPARVERPSIEPLLVRDYGMRSPAGNEAVGQVACKLWARHQISILSGTGPLTDALFLLRMELTRLRSRYPEVGKRSVEAAVKEALRERSGGLLVV